MNNIVTKIFRILDSGQKRRAPRVLAIMIIAAGMEAVGIGALLPFLNVVSDPGAIQQSVWMSALYERLGFTGTSPFLLFLGGLVFSAIILTQALSAANLWVQTNYVADLAHDFSVRLLERYSAKPYAYFLQENTSKLSRDILEETANRVAFGIFRPGLEMVSKGLIGLAVIALLLWVEPIATGLMFVLIGGIYGALYLYIRRRTQELGRERFDADERRFKAASEIFDTIRDIKILGREEELIDRFRRPSRQRADKDALLRVYSSAPGYLVRALTFGGLMALLLYLMAAGATLERIVPVMGVFAFAGYRVIPAFQTVIQGLAQFRYNKEVLDTLYADLVAEQPPDPSTIEEIEPLALEDSIQLDHVTYRYPAARQPVLDDISVEFPKDSAIALVGETGSGKTTIIYLLLGLLEPHEGRLLVDGEEVTGDRVPAWQRNIGYVPQDIYLIDDTVARNIALGLPDEEIDEYALVRAAKIAHIHDFIAEELAEGYGTVVGERGIRLSGGQRQRIGIARALYHDPQVLILDEATSEIDTVTEANIGRALSDLVGLKTLVVVAHRIGTIRKCDRIYVMDDGKVVGCGTYERLVETSGRFRELAEETRVPAVSVSSEPSL